ncbi:phosphomannomutase/phosphoglucomutase [Pelagibius sp. CAU 1746]|uniref:phosphoglucomutase/phosphomannomutase PgmG n=1 Tax=Pelagibius sp. CAU 1746 TaxID=3140370 RepID=UPI00325BD16B
MTNAGNAAPADAPHSFAPSLLREYDIRGIVGQTFSVADAEVLGRAFGSLARRRGGKSVAVGRDGRHSSPALAQAFIAGLLDSGIDAVDIGRGPTPMLYFAAHTLDVDGAVMVTGSHNPPEYNGLKLMLGKASFFGDDIQSLGRVAAAADYLRGSGAARTVSVFEAYVDRVLSAITATRSMKVAWDAGNGAMGDVMAAVAARLPGEHILLNETIDGDFPNHHPDPTVPENLKQLQQTVLAEGCDLGIAFDGDGDRVGFVDSKARILWGDQILLLLARDVLRRHPGAPIVGDVKCSQALFDGIAAAGGQPVMWKTGHSLIKTRMKELGAPLAGEMSAHLFIADGYYGYDDAIYAALRVLSVLQTSGEDLAGFRDSLPRLFNTPEIRVPCPEERKAPVIEEVKARQVARGADMTTIDGLRVQEGGGWWLLRASNTQDILVLRCEAASPDQLQALLDRARGELAASGLTLGEVPPESFA